MTQIRHTPESRHQTLGGMNPGRFVVCIGMNQHPHTEIVDVVCASCGTSHRVRSTSTAFSVDFCSNCHPAYTGIARTVNTGSRVERFNRRLALAG